MDNRGPRLRIPAEIKKEHIIQAIDEIKITRWPSKNDSIKYDLFYEGEKYPPKIVVMYANKYANGELFDVSKFTGGEDTTNKFFRDRGFEIVLKKDLVLEKYNEYSRTEIHELFGEYYPYQLRSGIWTRETDFIFLVTLDNQKTDTKIIQNEENERLPLYEHITENGILFWHSQPAQKQQDPQIKAFIDHDYLKNSIYLFLRTEKGRQYTYLGRLARVSYNRDTEKPVWFKWQILEWELEEQKAKEIGLILESDYLSTLDNVRKANTLNFTDPPEQKIAPPQAGESTPDFVARKNIDFADDEKKKREIGLAGEELVVALEKEKLREHGRSDLVGEIHHISKTKGDGAGYDIKSVTPNREIKYIEVKTTVGGLNTSFDITINELNFSKQFAQYYYLYRIYNFDKITKSGDCYVFRGDISRHYFLKPKKFKCDPQIKVPQSSDLDYIPGTIMKPKN